MTTLCQESCVERISGCSSGSPKSALGALAACKGKAVPMNLDACLGKSNDGHNCPRRRLPDPGEGGLLLPEQRVATPVPWGGTSSRRSLVCSASREIEL